MRVKRDGFPKNRITRSVPITCANVTSRAQREMKRSRKYILQDPQTPRTGSKHTPAQGAHSVKDTKLQQAFICTILFNRIHRDPVSPSSLLSLLSGHTPTSGCELTGALLQMVLEAVWV